MSNHIYDHVTEFLAGLELDDDTAGQVRRAVSDTFGATASSTSDPEGRFRVLEYRVVVLADATQFTSDEAISSDSLGQLAYDVTDGNSMLHTFEIVSMTPVGDDTISTLAEEAGSDPAWFLGELDPEDE